MNSVQNNNPLSVVADTIGLTALTNNNGAFELNIPGLRESLTFRASDIVALNMFMYYTLNVEQRIGFYGIALECKELDTVTTCRFRIQRNRKEIGQHTAWVKVGNGEDIKLGAYTLNGLFKVINRDLPFVHVPKLIFNFYDNIVEGDMSPFVVEDTHVDLSVKVKNANYAFPVRLGLDTDTRYEPEMTVYHKSQWHPQWLSNKPMDYNTCHAICSPYPERHSVL